MVRSARRASTHHPRAAEFARERDSGGVVLKTGAQDADEVGVEAGSGGGGTIGGRCAEEPGEVDGREVRVGRVDEDAADQLGVVHGQSAPRMKPFAPKRLERSRNRLNHRHDGSPR